MEGIETHIKTEREKMWRETQIHRTKKRVKDGEKKKHTHLESQRKKERKKEKKTERKRDGIPRRAILRYQDCVDLKLERTGCHIESKGRITPKVNKNKETKKRLDKTEPMIFLSDYSKVLFPQFAKAPTRLIL